MNWKLVDKNPATQPAQGSYKDKEWRIQIAAECHSQCVYCAINEAQFGGLDHFHIDHFRPKSVPRFESLENDILNLFLSCAICNRFKSNDWPAEPDLNTPSYPDPSAVDYADLFDARADGTVVGKYVAARYVETRLFLNRAQLIMERRESMLRSKMSRLLEEFKQIVASNATQLQNIHTDVLLEITLVKSKLLELNNKKQVIRPYSYEDIRRP